MSEPIPITIRSLDEPTGAGGDTSDDIAVTEALADVVASLVAVSVDVVHDIASDHGVPDDGPSTRLLHTGAGLAIEAVRTMGAWLGAAERSVADFAETNAVGRSIAAHGRSTWTRTHATGDEEVAVALRTVVEAILDRLDLTEVVREHLDIDAVASDLDLDRVVARLDIDAVTDRVDVDAIASRLDLEALIDRIDMAAVVGDVIDELDVPELIRETTADTYSDEIRLLRLQAVDADRLVQRAVDRVLGRKREP
jgi:hypothetical protein